MAKICLYEQMEDKLEKLAVYYSSVLSVGERGRTADGRYIWEAVLGSRKAKRHVLVQSSIHGREYLNTMIAMQGLTEVLEGYKTGHYAGKAYEKLFDEVCFHILPMTNPDGVVISQQGIKGIKDAVLREGLEECRRYDCSVGKAERGRKKYWRRWKANACGVDLNRNFDSGWKAFQGAEQPSSEQYKGKFPASEPEVQAILLAAEAYPPVCTISCHSSGNLIYWDYGSVGETYEKDRELARLVGEMTGYEPVSSVQDEQDGAGCSDYFVLERGIPSVTIENGEGECPLSMREYPSIWTANRLLLPALARFYASEN